MTGRNLALGLVALATGVAAWRLGWRQGHTIARYQAAVDAALNPSIDHSGCANTIAILRRFITFQEDELDRLRGDRPLHTPESFQFDEIIGQEEWPS